MSASLIRIATANLLETATSVADTGTPVTGFPIGRLYDRDVALQYKITEDCDREIIATGGIDAISINAIMFAVGHNVGGLAYTLAKSANGSSWTTVSTGNLPAGTGALLVEFTATTGAYWKLTLPHAQAVTLTELLLTNIYTCTDHADRDSSAGGKQYNVSSDETGAGSERWIINGPPRRWRRYNFIGVPGAMADEIESRIAALQGGKPFFICDHAGSWIWCNVTAPVDPWEVASISGTFKSFILEIREAL